MNLRASTNELLQRIRERALAAKAALIARTQRIGGGVERFGVGVGRHRALARGARPLLRSYYDEAMIEAARRGRPSAIRALVSRSARTARRGANARIRALEEERAALAPAIEEARAGIVNPGENFITRAGQYIQRRPLRSVGYAGLGAAGLAGAGVGAYALSHRKRGEAITPDDVEAAIRRLSRTGLYQTGKNISDYLRWKKDIATLNQIQQELAHKYRTSWLGKRIWMRLRGQHPARVSKLIGRAREARDQALYNAIGSSFTGAGELAEAGMVGKGFSDLARRRNLYRDLAYATGGAAAGAGLASYANSRNR